MSPKPKYKRKIYFINKELQGKMIFQYFILLALGSILFIGIFSIFSSSTLSIVYEDYQLQLGTTPGILFRKILSTQWLFIVLGGLAICMITLRLSHRVAGPFYRFEKMLDEMINKDLSTPVILREKDEGKELAKKINTFNSVLSKDFSLLYEYNSQIGVSVRQLTAVLEKTSVVADSKEIKSLVESIKQGQNGAENLLNGYVIEEERSV